MTEMGQNGPEIEKSHVRYLCIQIQRRLRRALELQNLVEWSGCQWQDSTGNLWKRVHSGKVE